MGTFVTTMMATSVGGRLLHDAIWRRRRRWRQAALRNATVAGAPCRFIEPQHIADQRMLVRNDMALDLHARGQYQQARLRCALRNSGSDVMYRCSM
jgi:hypothetical protein